MSVERANQLAAILRAELENPGKEHCKWCGRPIHRSDGYWMHDGWGEIDGKNGLYCSPDMWTDSTIRKYSTPGPSADFIAALRELRALAARAEEQDGISYDERQSELDVPAAEMGWDGATTDAERGEQGGGLRSTALAQPVQERMETVAGALENDGRGLLATWVRELAARVEVLRGSAAGGRPTYRQIQQDRLARTR